MQVQDNQYNYLQIDLDELPSRGLLYPEGTVFKARFMTILDVKFLSLLTPTTATRIVNELINRCVYMTIPFEDLLLCDREYFALWLRANSFMKESGYNLSIRNCTNCNRGFNARISLDELTIDYLLDKPVDIILPHSKANLKIKLPRISDQHILYDDKDIEYVARCLDSQQVGDNLSFVLDLDAYDFSYLMAACKRYKAGFNTHVKVTCENCGQMNDMIIVLSDDVLFAQIEMRSIVNLIMRVTKYVGCHIPDSTTWPELEMIQEITNAMVKEENDEMAKQEQKARASANAAKAKTPSNIHRH